MAPSRLRLLHSETCRRQPALPSFTHVAPCPAAGARAFSAAAGVTAGLVPGLFPEIEPCRSAPLQARPEAWSLALPWGLAFPASSLQLWWPTRVTMATW